MIASIVPARAVLSDLSESSATSAVKLLIPAEAASKAGKEKRSSASEAEPRVDDQLVIPFPTLLPAQLAGCEAFNDAASALATLASPA